ncbi:MAG: SPOR domain-containing protein [Hyphomicrobiaceae bacterium]
MAGSNGSPAQRGGPPPHWPAESEEQARSLELERWRQHQAQHAQQGYPHPHAQPAYQQPGPGFAQPVPYDPAQYGHPPQHGGYGQPQPADANPPARDPFEQQHGDPLRRQQGQYAPQFERFAPAPHPHDYPPAYDPHQLPSGGYEAVHDPFSPRRGVPQFDAPQALDPNHGYAAHDQLRAGHPQDAHAGHLDARADPQSWDLANYHPAQIPEGYHGQSAHDLHAQPEWGAPSPASHEPHWQHAQNAHGQWSPGGGHLQGQHYDPNAPDPYHPYPLDSRFQHADAQHAALEGDEYDAPEEARRGPSTVLVVGMLVGAIVVGGGLAFAYKRLGGGGSMDVAEIKRQTSPEKVRPKDPGGKTIEHSSNAFLNRASGSGAESRQSDVDGSAKKVSTIPIVVNRDGSLTPQSSSGSVPSDGSGVPGLVLDGIRPPPGPPQLRSSVSPGSAEAQPSRLPPPPPAVERTPPRIADLPLPKVTNARPQVAAAVERPTPPPLRKPSPPERDDAYVPRTTASAAVGHDTPRRTPTPSVSRSGFVAVLASKRSRQEALNAFADLHSQYPDILGSVTPDVREANLGEKGVWYRLIGGPPGSREAARNVCVKLKSRGMKDCWPVAY